MRLEMHDLEKVFNRRVIFSGLSGSIDSGHTLLITGRNGSGKSTLLKILGHLLTPTFGSVQILDGGAPSSLPLNRIIGFVSPYLNLYDEFSGRENLEFALSVRGLPVDSARMEMLLEQVSLGQAADRPVRGYSSGMKQRLKYAFALLHRPPILMLDEPMSNLDHQGAAVVRTIMNDQRKTGILIVATNDRTDVDIFEKQVDLDREH
jgi:heme exporter protein A